MTRFLKAIFCATPLLLMGCAGTPISKMDEAQLEQYRAQVGVRDSEHYHQKRLLDAIESERRWMMKLYGL